MTIIQPKDRFKIIPAVYLLLMKDGEILLSLRKNTGFKDGEYGLVSGHLDGDETVREAMVREAQEEAGTSIDIKDLRIAHVMHRSCGDKNNERADFFLTVKTWGGEIKNMEPNKCGGLNWFNLNNLPENTVGYIKQAIGKYQKNIFYSEFGWEK